MFVSWHIKGLADDDDDHDDKDNDQQQKIDDETRANLAQIENDLSEFMKSGKSNDEIKLDHVECTKITNQESEPEKGEMFKLDDSNIQSVLDEFDRNLESKQI